MVAQTADTLAHIAWPTRDKSSVQNSDMSILLIAMCHALFSNGAAGSAVYAHLGPVLAAQPDKPRPPRRCMPLLWLDCSACIVLQPWQYPARDAVPRTPMLPAWVVVD